MLTQKAILMAISRHSEIDLALLIAIVIEFVHIIAMAVMVSVTQTANVVKQMEIIKVVIV